MWRNPEARLTRVWLGLVLLTLAGMALSHAHLAPLAVGTAILAAAAAKAWWILLDFLEFRHVPAFWRGLFASLIAIVAGAAWAGQLFSVLRGAL